MRHRPPAPKYAASITRAAWPNPLLSADLAAVLGFPSAAAARRWVIRERVPHLRVGRRLAVRREALIEALRIREVRP